MHPTRLPSGPLRYALTAALMLAPVGCASHPKATAPTPPVVKTATATFGSVRPSELLAGVIAPFQNVAIQSSLSEPADAVYVQEGDRVTKGQVLARLNTADLDAALAANLATAASDTAGTSHALYQGSLAIAQGKDQVSQAQAAVRQAQTAMARDQADLDRYRTLFASGYLAQQQLVQQEATVRNDQQTLNSNQSALSSAQANVAANGTIGSGGLQSSTVAQSRATEAVAMAQAQQQRVQIAKATIVSPIDGVVVNRNLNPGEYPGTRSIFTLQQVDPVFAILHGSGSQIAQLAEGASATVIASDLHGKEKLTGKVAGVLDQINPGSTDFEVKVLLANPGRRLRSGMAVEGNVDLPTLRGVRVPVTAFTDDSHSAVMVVADDGTVNTAHVSELGNDGTTAVVSGLNNGVRIISDGLTSVGNGQKVAIR